MRTKDNNYETRIGITSLKPGDFRHPATASIYESLLIAGDSAFPQPVVKPCCQIHLNTFRGFLPPRHAHGTEPKVHAFYATSRNPVATPPLKTYSLSHHCTDNTAFVNAVYCIEKPHATGCRCGGPCNHRICEHW